MNAETYAYLAGVFDGEGNAGVIELARHHKGGKWRYRARIPYLQLGMNDKEPVELFRQTFGGGTKLHARLLPSGKVNYKWRVSCRVAKRAAGILLAFSRNPSKQKQLQLVLDCMPVHPRPQPPPVQPG